MMPPDISTNKRTSIDRYTFVSLLLIALLTFSVYFQLSTHEFLIIDDSVYVTNNQHVKTGIGLENILWAFTSLEAEFWHPLTWISYMVDTEVFGGSPGGYLFSNLILHFLNSILLFYLIKLMTGKIWESFLIAALFSLHPMHVEVVAWISERKELLCAFFWMAATIAYYQYAASYTVSYVASDAASGVRRVSAAEYEQKKLKTIFHISEKTACGDIFSL